MIRCIESVVWTVLEFRDGETESVHDNLYMEQLGPHKEPRFEARAVSLQLVSLSMASAMQFVKTAQLRMYAPNDGVFLDLPVLKVPTSPVVVPTQLFGPLYSLVKPVVISPDNPVRVAISLTEPLDGKLTCRAELRGTVLVSEEP